MNKLNIEATKLSPAISFYPETKTMEINGVFVMAEPKKFFEPVVRILKNSDLKELILFVHLLYSNNNSQKFFHKMFMDYVKRGNKLYVKWLVEEDDEDAIEMGEDFKMMVECEKFEVVKA